MFSGDYETRSRVYKTFTGIVGWAILFPWILAGSIITIQAIRLLINYGSEGSPISGVILFVAAFCLTPGLYFAVMVATNGLIITQDGIVIRKLEFDIRKLKASIVEKRAVWEEINSVSWIGAVNGPMLIKGNFGNIRVWIIFHDKTNAEIMKEISSKIK